MGGKPPTRNQNPVPTLIPTLCTDPARDIHRRADRDHGNPPHRGPSQTPTAQTGWQAVPAEVTPENQVRRKKREPKDTVA